ncbi:MAG: hypothetical protein RR661_02220 [Anaerovoracaceae bacterium]
MAKRLANVKTRKEAGLDYVVAKLNLETPFGIKTLKENQPFFPGEEKKLEEEFDRIQAMERLIKSEENFAEQISLHVLHGMKDISFTIERSKDNVLSMVELFELKSLMLQMETLSGLVRKIPWGFPVEFTLEDITPLLDRLDPRNDRLNTFYLYEEFSEKLICLRGEKRQEELALRKVQKEKREEIKQKYNVVLTPKFDYIVSKADGEELEKLSNIEELELSDQDYMSVTFTLFLGEQGDVQKKKIEEINGKLEEEEERIRAQLSKEVWSYSQALLENCSRIGAMDFTLAKARYALENQCVRPEISLEHGIEVEEGHHIQAYDILSSKGKAYIPISMELQRGVTCITGANMGGKTVSLKLACLVALLAQYGFFVPCKRAKVGLSNYIQMLIGDSQSLERGLSSFGSEMEELKEILDHSKDRSLLLVDEIASGTNPQEGLALTKSLIDYLKDRAYITLITTHFDAIGESKFVSLANADFEKLSREIRYANRKERIDIIAKYMDYRLVPIAGTGVIPKDALNIAKMLGINEEIIGKAKEYLKK